jgi:ribonuclease HI
MTESGSFELNVYCDGACSNNQAADKSKAKAAFAVWFSEGDKRNVAEELKSDPTNNRAELHAILRALELTTDHNGVTVIHTDSRLAIDSLTKYIKSWKRNNWRKSDGKPVLNQDLIKSIDRHLEARKNVKFQHVRSQHKSKALDKHSIGNAMADKLARALTK